MRRRALLERLGAGTAAASGVAGCLGDADAGDGSSADGTISIAGESIETTDAACADGRAAESDATVDVGADRVEIAGSIEAPNPCHEAVLETLDLASDGSELEVVVGAASADDLCQDCLGRLEYAATIAFEGGVPETVAVRHAERDAKTTVAETTDENAS